MSTIQTRLDNLQAAHARNNQRKGNSEADWLEGIRQSLQDVDGHPDLHSIPGEGLPEEMICRLQTVDGWNLDLMPGSTIEEKMHACDLACAGKLSVSDEARHAARNVFAIYEPLY